MILVQNPRQLLSGNSLYAVFLFFLFGCQVLKGTGSNSPSSNPVEKEKKDTLEKVVIDNRIKDKPEPAKKKETKSTEKAKTRTVLFQNEKYKVQNINKTYKIAIVLPFMLSGPTERDRMIRDIFLDYYQGAKLALLKAQENGLKAEIYPYDYQGDTNALKRLFWKKELQEMDLIIGGLGSNIVALLDDFCHRYSINYISTLTSLQQSINKNAYSYSFPPSDSTKAQLILDKMTKQFPNQRINIIIENNSKNSDLTNAMLYLLRTGYKNMKYQTITYSNWISWSNYLNSSDEIVFSNTDKKGHANVILNGLIRARKQVNLVVDESWLDFEGLDFKYLDYCRTYFISDSKYSVFKEELYEMEKEFKLQYGHSPDKYAKTAYGQFSLIGEMILAFGNTFPSFINYKYLEYPGYSFLFKKKNGVLENHYTYLVKYENYDFEVVE